MNNTARTNKEVRTNRGENVMRNTKATKNNKTMIAAISALVTATTMAAGLAVMAAFAPANKIETKAPASVVTTTESNTPELPLIGLVETMRSWMLMKRILCAVLFPRPVCCGI